MGGLEIGAVFVLIAPGIALWRVSRRVTLRDLVMVARATGSPRASLDFLRFCLDVTRS